MFDIEMPTLRPAYLPETEGKMKQGNKSFDIGLSHWAKPLIHVLRRPPLLFGGRTSNASTDRGPAGS
jgi:hypothetical protein